MHRCAGPRRDDQDVRWDILRFSAEISHAHLKWRARNEATDAQLSH